ncbi:hypothetical protein Tco_0846853, partial [Tanacetum coccineum]
AGGGGLDMAVVAMMAAVVGLLRWWWWLWRTVMRMAAGVWGSDDGDDNEGGVMVGCDDAEMFDVNTLTGDEVFTEQEVVAKDMNLTIDEVTLAQALAALKM